MPSGPPSSASRGSQSLTSGGRPSMSPLSMYGGLETTRSTAAWRPPSGSKRSPATSRPRRPRPSASTLRPAAAPPPPPPRPPPPPPPPAAGGGGLGGGGGSAPRGSGRGAEPPELLLP